MADINTSNVDNDPSNLGTPTVGGVKLIGVQNLTAQDSRISASTQIGIAGSVVIGEIGAPLSIMNLSNSTIEAAAKQAGGLSGFVSIAANIIDLEDNSFIQATNLDDTTGNSQVTLTNLVSGTVTNSLITTTTDIGKAGDIAINVGQNLNAVLTLDGQAVVGVDLVGGIVAGARVSSDAGNVTLNLGSLTINNNAKVSVESITGDAGDIGVTATLIDLNIGQILATTISGGSTSAANIILTGLNRLTAINSSTIAASTVDGTAGSVTIASSANPATTVNLTDSTIEAKATGTGNAGAVTIYTESLGLNNGQIQTSNVSGTSSNGNVVIDGVETLTATNGSTIAASTVNGTAGSVTIANSLDPATTVNLTGSTIEAKATGTGNAGAVTIYTETLGLDGGQIQTSNVSGTSSNGNVVIDGVETLTATNGSTIAASTVDGTAGSVTIANSGDPATTVNLTGSTIEAKATGTGNAGAVTIYTESLGLNNGQIQTSNISSNVTTGNVLIEGLQNLTATNGVISASTQTGIAGNVTVGMVGTPATLIDLTNTTIEAAATAAGGDAGSVKLYADSLSLNSSDIQTRNVSGTTGNGNVIIDGVEILTATNGSTIAASTVNGTAGSVTIANSADPATTVNLTGSTIEAKATGTGNAGAVTIYTESLGLNNGQIQTSNVSGTSSNGNVVIDGVESLTATNGSTIAASTVDGTAGSVTIANSADPATMVSLTGSTIEAKATGTGNAGAVTIYTETLGLDGGQIQTSNVSGTSSNGNVVIDGITSLTATNGIISASTQTGIAGDLTIGKLGTPLSQIVLNNSILEAAATAVGGNAGAVTLYTQALTANDSTVRVSNISAQQDTGDVILAGLQTLNLINSEVSASTETGIAGSVLINQNDPPIPVVRLTGESSISVAADSDNQIDTGTGTGTAGAIVINANQLVLTGNESGRSTISAATEAGSSQGINLTNLQNLIITQGDLIASTVDGTAADLTVGNNGTPLGQLLLNDGTISVAATGNGTAGQLLIQATEITATNDSEISASTNGGIGQDIRLENLDRLTLVDSQISASTATGVAGSILMNGGVNPGERPVSAVTLQGVSTISVAADQDGQPTTGNGQGTAGQILINSLLLTLEGNSNGPATISASTEAGTGQSITLQGLTALQVTQGSIQATTIDGAAGSLLINPNQAPVGSVTLTQGELSVAATGGGSSGSVLLNALAVLAQDGSTISASTNRGSGGNIQLPTLQTLVLDRSLIQASTEAGEAGSVEISAAQGVVATGEGAGVAVQANRAGQAGSLLVLAPTVDLRDGAALSVAAGGSGQGGNLTISPWGNGSDLRITLVGGEISGSTEGSGSGGTVTLSAPENLIVQGAGTISAETSGSGAAGSIRLSSRYGTLRDGVVLSTSTTSSGRGGDITITTGDRFLLQNATIATNATGSGFGGDITIVANDATGDRVFHNLVLDNGLVSATSEQSQGGSLNFVVANSLIMYRGSLISTGAGQLGNGGDININTRFLTGIPLQNNDIVANAIFGNGGRINLTAEGLFGFFIKNVDEPRRDPRNNITVSSRFGNSGIVAISTTLDPSQGLSALAVNLVDPSGLIDRRCSLRSNTTQSQFTLAGRGGLSPAPEAGMDLSRSQDDLRLSQGDGLGVMVGWSNDRDPSGIALDPLTHQATVVRSPEHPGQPWAEAGGWLQQGNVVQLQSTASTRSALPPVPGVPVCVASQP